MIAQALFPWLILRRAIIGFGWLAIYWAPRLVCAQAPFESAPINYYDATVNDRVAEVQRRLDAGEVVLRHDNEHGYLKDVLRLLDVPSSSQMLVFSQTSFQLRKISPRRPRAIFFSDDTYVGWVQGGDVIEVSSMDPRQGAIFYTLEQRPSPQPRFVRDRGQCMTCHASSRTQEVPGYLVRSVYVDSGGRPHYGSGTFTTDHTSPFQQRWGGWYVTGSHGRMRHMGNAISEDRDHPELVDAEMGANRIGLDDLFDATPYPQPQSDIVALMVLEHQAQMHNYLTLANYETRRAAHHDAIMSQALGREADYQSESTKRRVARAAESLVRYMLFVDEFQLTSPVKGVSEFAAEFSSRGRRDSQGRSLRDLDLQTRLFKYPCSYLIYTPAFDQLPAVVKQEVYGLLFAVLTGSDQNSEYDFLSLEMRTAIREILMETKSDLAVQWRQ